jgi:hypothetical protein
MAWGEEAKAGLGQEHELAFLPVVGTPR